MWNSPCAPGLYAAVAAAPVPTQGMQWQLQPSPWSQSCHPHVPCTMACPGPAPAEGTWQELATREVRPGQWQSARWQEGDWGCISPCLPSAADCCVYQALRGMDSVAGHARPSDAGIPVGQMAWLHRPYIWHPSLAWLNILGKKARYP